PPRAERGAGGRAHRGRAHRRRRLRPRHPCRGAAHGLRVGGSRAGAGNGTLGRRRRRDDLAALLSRPVRRRVSPASDAGDGVRAGADRRGVGPTRRDGSVRPAVPGGPRPEPRRPRRPAGPGGRLSDPPRGRAAHAPGAPRAPCVESAATADDPVAALSWGLLARPVEAVGVLAALPGSASASPGTLHSYLPVILSAACVEPHPSPPPPVPA